MPKCNHCGTTESKRFYVSDISTVCATCMSNFIDTTDVDGDEEDTIDSSSSSSSSSEKGDYQSSSSSSGSGSGSSAEDEGGYVKSRFQICAMCCRGPPQEGLKKQFTISLEKAIHSCSGCHSAYFCSKECQKKAWSIHKIPCQALSKRNKIACVTMSHPTNCQQIFLDPDDPSFAAATPSRIMHLAGIPLAILPLEAGENNQLSTYLLINPVSGLAPMQFQSLGEVLICRLDRMPITPVHVHQLGDYIFGIIEQFGNEDDENVHKKFATKASFVRFLTAHVQGGYFNPLGVSW